MTAHDEIQSTFSISGVFSPLPSQIGNLPNLTHLTLNRFVDTAGTTPFEVVDLSNMAELNLIGMAISESSWLSSVIVRMTNLQLISIGNADFGRTISSEIVPLSNLNFWAWLELNWTARCKLKWDN